MLQNDNKKLKKEISVFVATALVVGNMMGSGIFMLPSNLANVGGVGTSILAWIFTGAGSLILALTFANLGSKIPKTGGAYEYARLAYGEFTGFMTAWLYWNGSWIGNATIFIVVTTYLGTVFPALLTNNIFAFIFCSLILWGFTFINIMGTKFVGKITTAITVFKIGLFIFFIVVAGFNFDVNNLIPLFPEGKGLNTLPLTAAITLWAFMGLETASVTSGEIKDPEKNVKKSTILGMIISIVLYLGISIFAMGAMSQTELANSSAPIVDIISQFFGSEIMVALSISIAISISGTGLGWLLSTARVAYAAGEDGVFPKVFAKLHPKYNSPYISLIIGSILINLLFLLNFSKGLVGAYQLVVLLATLSYLPIYALCAMAEIILLGKETLKKSKKSYILLILRNILGFLFAIWAIYASGSETVMYGFLLIMLGIPLYVYMKIKNNK